MPVTIVTANHASKKWTQGKTNSSEDLLARSSPADSRKSESIIQSSISRRAFREEHITPSSNGLVWAAFHAYSGHHHLTMRPEDVWFAILSQLSFYINAHAEELRSFFVSHEGRKELWVEDIGSIKYMDFGALAQRMTNLIQENVKTPDLRTWIMPSFSTTTDCDRTVASILMMGSMQKYFSYGMSVCCGIPSVTLLGEREDWEDILQRLDMLPQLGDEPGTFADLLRPVLRNFIASFEPETAESVLDFWGRIAHRDSMMSGFSGYLSGWLTSFCFWDVDGKLLYSLSPALRSRGSRPDLVLDGIKYHRVEMESIPAGFVSVPVTVKDNGEFYYTRMIAGSIGVQATSRVRTTNENNDHAADDDEDETSAITEQDQAAEATGESNLNSIQPLTGWLMYETKDSEESHIKKTTKLPPLTSSSIAGRGEKCGNGNERVAPQNKENVTQILSLG